MLCGYYKLFQKPTISFTAGGWFWIVLHLLIADSYCVVLFIFFFLSNLFSLLTISLVDQLTKVQNKKRTVKVTVTRLGTIPILVLCISIDLVLALVKCVGEKFMQFTMLFF